MNIGDILYFSPKYRFIELDLDDENNLISAFQDRVEGFYLKPARELKQKEHAFARGVLCVTAIDFLARIEQGTDKVRQRFEKWFQSNAKEFTGDDPDNPSQLLSRRFYDEFRNGLVHEGRIKNGGQFSYEFEDKLVDVNERIMTVNPSCLLDEIDGALKRYIDKLKKEKFAFQAFKCV